jgi:uracil DNA glycosylase
MVKWKRDYLSIHRQRMMDICHPSPRSPDDGFVQAKALRKALSILRWRDHEFQFYRQGQRASAVKAIPINVGNGL